MVSECIFNFVFVRVAGNQSFVVRKDIVIKIMEQIVIVTYLKKKQISQGNICVGFFFGKLADLRAQLS